MLFRRLYDESLAQASYLVACQQSKEAIIVDPLRDPAPYLEAARQEGVRITLVTETHVHADFVSGARALASAAGAELRLSGASDSAASYHRSSYPEAGWLAHGDAIRVGKVRLDVLHVPGHTPEHIAFVVTDEATSPDPVGLLSGDFLFVGDVGRPDLLERAVGAAGTMEGFARDLFRSLRTLDALPDYLQIWPGHGAGSACGKSLGAVPQSTLGYERRANWAFGITSEPDFVTQVLAGQPEPPPYFARMKRLNATGGLSLQPHVASDAAARRALAAGALVVDLRPPDEFIRGHLAGALSIPGGRSFLGWAGSVLDPDRDIVLLTGTHTRHLGDEALGALSTIGIDRVAGVLAVDDLSTLGAGPLVALATVPAESIGTAATASATILDVRNGSEWTAGHIPGARHIPLPQLAGRLEELRGSAPLIVHCQGGSRSVVAASLLQSAGFPDVSNATGGYSAWLRVGNALAVSE